MKTNIYAPVLTRLLMLSFCSLFISLASHAQNTFPSTGRAGIYTTSPATSLQVKGGARFGTLSNYVNIDSATGNLSFVGTSGYQVDGNKYAFQYSGNPNYGLYFNSSAQQYEFRNSSAVPVFIVNANSGNSVFSGTLKVGAYTLPVTDGTSGQVLKTNGAGVLAWNADNNTVYTAGTGISISGTTITNSAPDKTVALTGNGATTVSGTYPNFTIASTDNNTTYSAGSGLSLSGTTFTNTAPDKTVTLTAGAGISVTGTYPSFTVTNTGTGSGSGWSLTGNAGTNPSTNFIGTTDAQSLVFKVNNQRAGLIEYSTCCSGTRNTSFGLIALNSNTTGADNTATGYGSLYTNTTGNQNVAYGKYALFNNNANNNTALGFNAMFFNTNGTNNTATGVTALQNNTSGIENTANGSNSLAGNQTGSDNTATGFAALNSNSANNNTANGAYSLYLNTSGQQNTANGYAALYSNTIGNYNSAHGAGALNSNIDGLWSTANGAYALYHSTHGGYNTANGGYTLYNNTTGNSNVANGYDALYNNISGNYNTASGNYALYSTTGNGNSANGYEALFANTSGTNNTASGFAAAWSNTSGYGNVAIGTGALYSNSSLTNVVAIGDSALYNLASNYEGGIPSGNTALGSKALFSNSGGSLNTATGYQALYNNQSGAYNTANGYQALYSNIGNTSNASGYYNTADGYQALSANTTGSSNVAVGVNALTYNNTGGGNVAIGQLSLYGNNDGNDNSALGYAAGFSSGSSLSNSTSLGSGASATASNQVRIGDNIITSIGGYASWTNISDGRVKKNIKENVPGIAFINKLKPITYNLDLDAADKIIQPPTMKDKNGKTFQLSQIKIDSRKAKEQIIYTGFIAQDVEKAAKSLNYDFSGVDAAKNSKDLYGLRYAEFVVPLVKAVQELSASNDTKDAKIDTLQSQLNDLKTLVLSIQQKQQQCSPCNASIDTKQTQSFSTLLADGSSLLQNVPNPFSNTTSIGYTLPQQFRNAQIIIIDKNGKTLKQVTVSGSGKGSLLVDASTLSSGAYQYSLLVDGKLIGTRQMILARQ